MLIRSIKMFLITAVWSISAMGVNLGAVMDARILSAIPVQQGRACPKDIKITGKIMSVLPTNIRYQFVYSDGHRSQPQRIRTQRPGPVTVHTQRRFNGHFNGWVKLKVLSPNRKNSRNFALRVQCRNGHLPGGVIQRIKLQTEPVNAAAPCPKTIHFKGTIRTKHAANIRYRFIRSNGTQSPIHHLRANRAGTYHVRDSWRIDRATRGWVKLKIISPDVLITPQEHFQVACPQVHPPRRLRVEDVTLRASSREVTSRCPKSMHFVGTIKTNRAGTVRYQFVRSNGTNSRVYELQAPRAGVHQVSTNWRLRNSKRGWVRLKILSPNRTRSDKAHFRLRCLPAMPVIPNDPMHISEFRLEADPQLPQIYRGDCPKTIDLHGEFFASRAGIIRYRFRYSDGRVGTTRTIHSDGPGFYSARESWRIGRTSRGWARMEILSPVRVRSEKASFAVQCMGQEAPAELKSYIDAPRQAYAGEDLTDRIKILIRNHGHTRALGTRDGHGYQVDVILSSDRASVPEFATYSNTYRDNVLLKGGRISRTTTLAPAGSQTYLPNAVLPERIPAGNYYLCARVDPGNAVRESNERNNLSCTPLRILSRQRPQPEVFPEGTAGSTLREDGRSVRNNDKDDITDDSEIELLKRFRPYFRFSKEERYLPSDALYQLRHAEIKKGKIAESAPSFLHPERLSSCTGIMNDPQKLLLCDNHSMDLLNQLHPGAQALDLNDSLRTDTGSGKPNDWDSAISVSPGLYGHVVEDEGLIKIEYWQYFPYSESNNSGFGHEGDWETIQLWYHDVTDKIVGVCHWAHGAGICFDMNKGKKIYSENGFTYYQGANSNYKLEKISPKDLEHDRYPSAYQNYAIAFYTKNNNMHPVVYIEKNTHAFWPTPLGEYIDGDTHEGEGHNYLTTFEEEMNLGEFSATLPNAEHSNSLILRYNGLWGAEHQNLTKPPHGPTQRCQWNYSDNEFEMTKTLKKSCEWE